MYPTIILGIDTDNGGEFINEVVIAFCEQEHISFVSQLFSAFDETALERTRGEESALRLRFSENSTATIAPIRRPTCGDAAGTARGRSRT